MIKLSTGVIHMCAKPVGIAQDHARYLTALVRSRLADEPVCRIARARCMVLLAVLCIVGTVPATAAQEVKPSIDYLKLYAHSRIVNYKEFQCFNTLITKESNWRVDAINGSHYGLGQMRNLKYRNLDGFRQIDWSIRYNIHRYKTHCNTLKHFLAKGWH